MSSQLIEQLLEIMQQLRDPEQGCPWDREQTFSSLVSYTLEEAYEVADAIEQEDPMALREELGDLLLQVIFYAQIAAEDNLFDFFDVVSVLCQKLRRRHPHVFGDEKITSVAEQSRAWEAHKEQEQQMRNSDSARNASVLDGVAMAMPALVRGVKLQQKAARVGFDWTSVEQVMGKVREELAELQVEIDQQAEPQRLEHEVGDLLQAVSNLARHLNIDAESAMRQANRRFEHRFHWMEKSLRQHNQLPQNMSLDELETLWLEAKAAEI